MDGLPHPALGLLLALLVGFVLGLLGGGGSILALPIFLYIFLIPVKPAVAMSLAVVGMSAFVGFLSHWRQGTVNLRIALPFGACAMVGAFGTARVARHVPEQAQLGLFAVFAVTASLMMLRDSLTRAPTAGDAPPPSTRDVARFTPPLALQALGVGALTSLIGAGGGFVIVPALVLLAHVPIRTAVGSSLLIITMNSLSGFAGYVGQVAINWRLVGSFTGVAAIGALIGTRMVRRVPQARIKQGFAVMILVLGSYFALRKLHILP